MTVAFLAWYLLYVVMSNWAHDFMSTKVVGNINVALVFGLLQFVTTFLIAWSTPATPTAKLDPLADDQPEIEAAYRRARSPRLTRRAPSTARPSSCSSVVRRAHRSASPSGPAGRPARPPTSTPAAARSPASRTASPSAATTCPPRRSSASPAPIALYGYDGFLYSIGFLVAWLVALLLVAELLRNSGRYTMADALAYRMRQRPVRTAAATSTVVVSIFYLLAQMVGAGALVALLLGIDGEAAKNLDHRRRRRC